MHCGPPFPVITSLLAAHPLSVYTHPNLSCCPHLPTHSHTHRRGVLLSFLQQFQYEDVVELLIEVDAWKVRW